MPLDYGWTPPSQPAASPLDALPRRPGYQPLLGTLNALSNGSVPQDDTAQGLVLPGQTPYVSPTSSRPATMGDIGRTLLGGVGAIASVPRQAAWNLGPALVGRSGQGPQTGAEALQGLGMNGPVSGAIAAGLGRGLDLLADPMNLIGMGAGRGASGASRAVAPAADAGVLTRRLEQMVAPVAEANAAGRVPVQARIDNWVQGVGHPGTPFAPGAGGPLADAGALPRPSGSLDSTVLGGGSPAGRRLGAGARGSVDPATYGYDVAATRSQQLNSPNFNPNNPAFGLGTGQFTQDASHAARMGVGEYNPLSTARFMPGAASAETAAPSLTRQLEAFSQTPQSRLDRMLGRRPAATTPSVD